MPPAGQSPPSEVEMRIAGPTLRPADRSLTTEFIVCLGAVDVRAVLRSTEPVGAYVGRFHPYRKARVLVTYHPAYLLRNPDSKRLVWDDMKC